MLKYRALVRFDAERSVYVATAPELPECTAEAETRADAVSGLEDEISARVAALRSEGVDPPRPIDELGDDDGDGDQAPALGSLDVRISLGLHRELLFRSRAEGVELDHLVGELLAAGLVARDRPRRSDRGGRGDRQDRQESGRRRGGRDYQAIMDDKATFLEYVRGLDQGGQGQRSGRGRGGGRGRGQ